MPSSRITTVHTPFHTFFLCIYTLLVHVLYTFIFPFGFSFSYWFVKNIYVFRLSIICLFVMFQIFFPIPLRSLQMVDWLGIQGPATLSRTQLVLQFNGISLRLVSKSLVSFSPILSCLLSSHSAESCSVINCFNMNPLLRLCS